MIVNRNFKNDTSVILRNGKLAGLPNIDLSNKKHLALIAAAIAGAYYLYKKKKG